MSVFSIILLALLGVYIAIWAVDRFVMSPRRDKVTIAELKDRVEKLEKEMNTVDDETASV